MNLPNPFAWHTDALDRVGIRIVTPATEEPISLADAANHLRLDRYGSPEEFADQDWLTMMIPAARELCESLSGLALASQTYGLSLGRFPVGWGQYQQGIDLKLSPVLGVESVTYIDETGVSQTLAASAYSLDVYARPGRLYPAIDTSWPATAAVPNAVVIRFVAGFSAPGASPQDAPLPAQLRSAMLLTLGHLYENREASSVLDLKSIPLGVTSLLEGYRVRDSMA